MFDILKGNNIKLSIQEKFYVIGRGGGKLSLVHKHIGSNPIWKDWLIDWLIGEYFNCPTQYSTPPIGFCSVQIFAIWGIL